MQRMPCGRPGPDSAHRARFEALREKIFEEMGQGSARWRLQWILPIHLLIVVLLLVSGESTPRAIIQVACIAVMSCLFMARVFEPFSKSRLLSIGSFVFWITSYFLLCATTGGLASPMLVTLGLMICVVSISMQRPVWVRPLIFGILIVGFVTLALLSHTPVGQLAGPLAPTANGPSAVHLCVALFAVTVTMIGIFRMGWTVTAGYERAALELAERRDELCLENEDRTRALEGLAARLAHEVKNPLAAIKGLSTHMARNATDAKTAERLAIVAAEADRLQSIVDGFLTFSRGLDDLNVSPTRPFEIARELGVLLETRAEEAGVSIEASGDANLLIDADPRKLRQALLNIVLNAIQASDRGMVVSIGVVREGSGAKITVRDEGVGMTPEILNRIRKPHFTTKEGGTGLGLAVARGLFEQHGGTLDITSAPRKGTTVTIFVPMTAKPCAKLPFPIRAFRPETAETAEAAPAVKPATAGVR
jgi:signal transduction histidine kinase